MSEQAADCGADFDHDPHGYRTPHGKVKACDGSTTNPTRKALMTMTDSEQQSERHNHTTRSIEPWGRCPACDTAVRKRCTCPFGDLKLGRLHGVDMGIKRDARLSASPTCPVHQGKW